MHSKHDSFVSLDLDQLETVSGGAMAVETNPDAPGDFDTRGKWIPGRYNMNLDGADFGNAGQSGLGLANTAERAADARAADFLHDNPGYDLVVYDGTLANGSYISGAFSDNDLQRTSAEGSSDPGF